jgi:CRISPR/Cas system-associated exonuclease Cas4 (RecB family)
MDRKIIISKSKYMAGLQCPRYLWYQVNAREEIPKPGFVATYIFKQGIQVGEYAKRLYPGGIDVEKTGDLKTQLVNTFELLSERKTLFEASCSSQNVYNRADILVPADKDRWDIVEVKSSTQLKEEYIHDVSFQKYCFEKAGVKIRKCYLMYINNQYVKKGEINTKALFKKTDITAEVEDISSGIENRIKEMLKIAAEKSPPETPIGKHCNNPYSCPLKDKCWDFLPENHIFNLYGNKEKAVQLYSEGILSIKDIPDRYDLNLKQQIQLECARTEKPKINKDEISKFIRKLGYPLYFFDFETFSTAIPLYDGVKPYQRIPFQYSIHMIDSIDSKPVHYDFLAEGDSDPREKLLSNLKRHLGEKGSIIVYYELFEKGVLREQAETFPKYRKWVNSILPRIVDLYKPFGDFHYYSSSQKGSASVKSVLPAITDLSYKGMEIAEGLAASVYFLYICGKYDAGEGRPTREEVDRIRKSLIKYCRMDTGGMIHILKALIKEAL